MDPAHARYITDDEGRKTAVILPIKNYRQLLEDLHDLAVVAERRDQETISLQEMQRRLKSNGII